MKAKYIIDALAAMKQAETAIVMNTAMPFQLYLELQIARINLSVWSGLGDIEVSVEAAEKPVEEAA